MTRDLGPAPLARCLLVLATLTAATTALAAWLLPSLHTSLAGWGEPGTGFDTVLVSACEAALLGVAGWVWAVATVVTIDAARGRVRTRRGVPTAVRRLVLAACGAALVGGLVAPAHAEGDRPAGGSVVVGLALPDRPTAASSVAALVASATRHPAPEPRRTSTVVVSPGDTLWALAAASLPPGAADADVAAAVTRLHAVNRGVVGADPDLIQPGQVLRLPSGHR